MLLYWFIPALANSNVGSSWGTTDDEGQCVCAWRWKYSTKVLRILAWGQPSGVLGMRSPRRIAFVLASRLAAIFVIAARRVVGVQQWLY